MGPGFGQHDIHMGARSTTEVCNLGPLGFLLDLPGFGRGILHLALMLRKQRRENLDPHSFPSPIHGELKVVMTGHVHIHVVR